VHYLISHTYTPLPNLAYGVNRSTDRLWWKFSSWTGGFIESWVSILKFFPYQTFPQKNSPKSNDSEKQPTTSNETISNCKSIATTWGIVSPSGLNLNPIVEETVSAPLQGVAEDIH